jgi:hypothetical protein
MELAYPSIMHFNYPVTCCDWVENAPILISDSFGHRLKLLPSTKFRVLEETQENRPTSLLREHLYPTMKEARLQKISGTEPCQCVIPSESPLCFYLQSPPVSDKSIGTGDYISTLCSTLAYRDLKNSRQSNSQPSTLLPTICEL